MAKFLQTLRFGLLAAAAAALCAPGAAAGAPKKAKASATRRADAPAQAVPGSQIPWKTDAYTLVANNMDLRTALDTFAISQGLSAVMSAGVGGTFSGSFQDVRPADFLDRIATTHNLVWYYDGAALYFYGAGEIRTLLLDLQYMKAGEIRAMLAELGVEDGRFPLKTTSNDELVMVSGPPRYVSLIAELVAKADKLRELRTFNEVEARLFPLVHTWADDVSFGSSGIDSSGAIRGVASLLNEIMAPAEDAKAHVRDAADESADALSPVEAAMLAEFKPVIRAEPRLNAVIVRDVVSRMPMYERLIRQLDVPQRLVEIEVTVVELTKADALDWQLSLSGSGQSGEKTSWGAGQNAANLFELGDLSGKGLAGAVTYLGDKFAVNASLTALKSKNKARSISRTSLLTVNNLAAEMSDSQSYHARVVGSEVATLEEVTAGTTLQIKPRILPTGTSEVANQVWLSMKLDDGGFESVTVDAMPMTRTSGLITQTAVFEDESIMLAGYLRDIEEAAGWGIPFLRDIPLIGWLFGGSSTRKETVQRMFIISPHVIDLDLEAVGRAQAARMRDLTVPEAMQDDADEDDLERERRDLERGELRRIRVENARDDLERRRAELDHERVLRAIERDNAADELDADIREWRAEERELRRENEKGAKSGKRRPSRKKTEPRPDPEPDPAPMPEVDPGVLPEATDDPAADQPIVPIGEPAVEPIPAPDAPAPAGSMDEIERDFENWLEAGFAEEEALVRDAPAKDEAPADAPAEEAPAPAPAEAEEPAPADVPAAEAEPENPPPAAETETDAEAPPAVEIVDTAAAAWERAVAEHSETAALRALDLALSSNDPQGPEIARRAQEEFRDSAAVQTAAGNCWEKSGDPAAAMEAFMRAQTLDPENADALWALARTAGAAGRTGVEGGALVRLVKLEPRNADALWALAETSAEKLESMGKGLTLFKAFAKRFPDDPRAEEAAQRVADMEKAAEN